MKKIYFIPFALFVLVFSLVVQAQKNTQEGDIQVDRQIKGVLIGGFNLSQVDGDEVYGFNKFGINAGFGGILPLGHRFSLSVEVLYNEKGAFRKYAPEGDSIKNVPYYSLKWNYLTAPVMVHFEDRNTWTFGLGFSWGRMVGFKELEHNKPQEWNRPDSVISYKSKNDFSVIADLRLRIWKHLKLNVQYSYSLAKIRTRIYDPDPGRTDPWTRNQYNNVITVRLLYYLNEKYLPDRFKFKKTKKVKKTKPETKE